MLCRYQSPHHWKEARRLPAWRLQQQGWSQCQIANALGVSEGAVSQWMMRARDGGDVLNGSVEQLVLEALA